MNGGYLDSISTDVSSVTDITSINLKPLENLSDQKNNEAFNELKNMKLKNINCISVAQININSLRNKFEFSQNIVK